MNVLRQNKKKMSRCELRSAKFFCSDLNRFVSRLLVLKFFFRKNNNPFESVGGTCLAFDDRLKITLSNALTFSDVNDIVSLLISQLNLFID